MIELSGRPVVQIKMITLVKTCLQGIEDHYLPD